VVRFAQPAEWRVRVDLVAEQRAGDGLRSALVPDSVLKRAPNVLFERVGSDTAVLEPATGLYTRLNSTGSVLWDLLDTPSTAAALADHLAREFGLDPGRAREDVDRFAASLRDRGLLESS
jgi:hypothetical protein